jgi:hypothetical protein
VWPCSCMPTHVWRREKKVALEVEAHHRPHDPALKPPSKACDNPMVGQVGGRRCYPYLSNPYGICLHAALFDCGSCVRRLSLLSRN